MAKHRYEIYLGEPALPADAWQQFLAAMQKYLGLTKPWRLIVRRKNATLHFYLECYTALPSSMNVPNFLLQLKEPANDETADNPRLARPFFFKAPAGFAELLGKLYKKNQEFCSLEIDFQAFPKRPFASAMVVFASGGQKFARSWLILSPASFLSYDFAHNKHYAYKKPPKYLSVEKSLKIFQSHSDEAVFKIDPFPFGERPVFLSLGDYDFAKHSLVLGSSGTGKSKFLALLIRRLAKLGNYKVVVVDPHDNLRHDLADLTAQQVINFRSTKRSVDLFKSSTLDIGAHVELLIGAFKELMNNNYNGRAERVLRYSCYLLLAHGDFSFLNLRELLLDLDTRNRVVAEMRGKVPTSVQHFFLTEFSELKNQAYDRAIAPIIAFLDEVSMVPIFNQRATRDSLVKVVQANFLTLFSLNRLKLGDQVVKTIASLIYQQLFLLAESGELTEHLVIIVDEVAVVESEILSRFLSELRKFNVSVILAGQYFNQVSDQLKSAILANTTNYYIFRVSKPDAATIAQNLSIKVIGSDAVDAAEQLITGLKLRECLVRIEHQGKLLPPFVAKTIDLEASVGSTIDEDDEAEDTAVTVVVNYDFLSLDTRLSSDDVMHLMTTSRKILPEK